MHPILSVTTRSSRGSRVGLMDHMVPQPPPVLIFLFLVVFCFYVNFDSKLWCTGNLSGEIIFCYFRPACLFYLLFLKLLWSLLASSFSIQTLLFNFIWSDFLLVSCLRGAGFCLITSSPLSLHLELSVFTYAEKPWRGSAQIIGKLYGAPTRLLVLNYSDLLTYPQW